MYVFQTSHVKETSCKHALSTCPLDQQNTLIFVIDGLLAQIVDVWHSCHICEMWMCGLRVIYVLLAIEPAFFCKFWKPPRAGEVLPKFCTYTVVFLVLQSRTCRRGPGAPRHNVASPLHRLATAPVFTATLGIINLHPLSLSYLGRVTQLGVSRPKEIRPLVYVSVHIRRPYLFRIVHVCWTARGCVDD